jgi:sugar phosphate isomerase/epimerase
MSRSITRREFGKVALTGASLSMALARAESGVSGVRIGVQSYSFRTMSLDDAIAAMKAIGLGECELWAGHVEPRPPEGQRPDRDELRKWRLSQPLAHFTSVRRKFDAAGVKLQAYTYGFRDDFTDEEIDRGFEMARALGVPLITASSTISAARRIAPFAEKHGITVGMHGHSDVKNPNEFATPESFAQALALSKRFAVNLDIGHFVAANFDPVAYIEEHHDRISNLHLKDRRKNQGDNVPWGQGDTPIREVLRLLRDKNYDIPANIEYEYDGADATAEVRKCFEFCKAALA